MRKSKPAAIYEILLQARQVFVATDDGFDIYNFYGTLWLNGRVGLVALVANNLLSWFVLFEAASCGNFVFLESYFGFFVIGGRPPS